LYLEAVRLVLEALQSLSGFSYNFSRIARLLSLIESVYSVAMSGSSNKEL